MPGRADVVERIAELVGGGVLRISQLGSGWPSLCTLELDEVAAPVALFAAPVGLSHRDRDDVERRFQNPGGGRPIVQSNPPALPLLLGLWESDPDPRLPVTRPLLVSADPIRRIGRTTRFSVFVSVGSLRAALATGWSQDENALGETIRCLSPPLLPLSYVADRDGAVPAAHAMHAAIDGSGLLSADDAELPAASERARRAGSALMRDARFSRRVIAAYEGLCAMCGLGVGLVQGAHIYPVAAPGSSDAPRNGLALCPNHHLAFDHHVLAVVPGTRQIIFCDDFVKEAKDNPAAQRLIDSTFDRLSVPRNAQLRPHSSMFERRYEFYVGQYDWMG